MLLASHSFAQEKSLIISSEKDIYSIEDYLTVYATADSLLGPQAHTQIQNGSLQAIAAKSNQGMIKNTAFWVRFDLTNQEEDGSYYIEVDNPQIDLIRFYEITENDIKTDEENPLKLNKLRLKNTPKGGYGKKIQYSQIRLQQSKIGFI